MNPITMENVDDAPLIETVTRRVGSTKARRVRSRKDSDNEAGGEEPNSVQKNVVEQPNSVHENGAQEPVGDETVRRERGLLLATLRVWELKQGIRE